MSVSTFDVVTLRNAERLFHEALNLLEQLASGYRLPVFPGTICFIFLNQFLTGDVRRWVGDNTLFEKRAKGI